MDINVFQIILENLATPLWEDRDPHFEKLCVKLPRLTASILTGFMAYVNPEGRENEEHHQKYGMKPRQTARRFNCQDDD
jgi:hypothetical protein